MSQPMWDGRTWVYDGTPLDAPPQEGAPAIRWIDTDGNEVPDPHQEHRENVARMKAALWAAGRPWLARMADVILRATRRGR